MEKVVADYANQSIPEVQDYDLFTFWGLLRDAVIYNHSQTKKGREWLNNAYRLTCTEPDVVSLRKKYG